MNDSIYENDAEVFIEHFLNYIREHQTKEKQDTEDILPKLTVMATKTYTDASKTLPDTKNINISEVVYLPIGDDKEKTAIALEYNYWPNTGNTTNNNKLILGYYLINPEKKLKDDDKNESSHKYITDVVQEINKRIPIDIVKNFDRQSKSNKVRTSHWLYAGIYDLKKDFFQQKPDKDIYNTIFEKVLSMMEQAK